MRKKLLLLALTAVTFCGCTYYIRPATARIKSLAVVSVYMNKDFYLCQGPNDISKGDVWKQGEQIRSLVHFFKGGPDSSAEAKEREKILSHALKSLVERLGSLGVWQVVPPEALINNPRYQTIGQDTVAADSVPDGIANAVACETVGAWETAPGMRFIPLRLTDPPRAFLNDLSVLARDLGVDAVAIVKLSMGYGMGSFGLTKFVGALGGTANAIPIVVANMTITTKDGFLVAWMYNRAESDKVKMVQGERAVLTASDGKAVESYNKAIDKSLGKLTGWLAKKVK